MAKDLNSQNEPDQPYVNAIANLMQLGMKASMQPQYWTSLGKWLTGWQKEHDSFVEIAHNFTNEVITERMEQLRKGEDESNRKAFLDLLISHKEEENLSIEDIREEVDTFMFAGHDTTSSSLGWIIWCLSHHMGEQDKVYEEMEEIFGDDVDRDCTKDDMAKMIYLERCIKESMRLFPPVPFVIRHLENDFKMGDHLLPKGSSIVIAPYAIHRNDQIYENPDTFNPDNFLPEKIDERHPYDYIPFSAGPRNCIGQKFAMYEMKIVISWILRLYRIESTRDFDENARLAEVVLRPRDGILVTLHKRRL